MLRPGIKLTPESLGDLLRKLYHLSYTKAALAEVLSYKLYHNKGESHHGQKRILRTKTVLKSCARGAVKKKLTRKSKFRGTKATAFILMAK